MDPTLLIQDGHQPGGAYPRRIDLDLNLMVVGLALVRLLDQSSLIQQQADSQQQADCQEHPDSFAS